MLRILELADRCWSPAFRRFVQPVKPPEGGTPTSQFWLLHSFTLRCILAGSLLYALNSFAFAELRVATYNLDNYLSKDRVVSGRWRPDYPKPESEKAMIRRIIMEVQPDVLALQEIGSPGHLEELHADLARDGLDYTYAVHLSGPDEVRHIALLSKIPSVEVVKHTDLDFKYYDERERVKRGMLEVSFKDEDEGEALFKLFVVHLKSKYTSNKEDPNSELRRTREAEACRDRIIERTFDLGMNRFLVTGDFNDHPSSAPLRRFYRRGDLHLGSLVPAVDGHGLVWTYFYEKHAQYSLVDGFVASPEMLPLIKNGRGHIAGGLESLIGSDHRMVYLDLALVK